MTNCPSISIVTPCFNSGEFLEETILSVLQQNYPNLEYIIIDGGSTDNSIEIIQKYQDKLSFWISEKDNGMYDALQKGFSKTTGEIMAWINADDLYHKNSFFIISELFEKFNDINWLVGASTFFDEKSRCIQINQSKIFTRYDFLIGNFKWIQQESCFWRRSLWEKSGSYINSTLKYAGDLDLWIRFFRYESLYITNSLIGVFRLRCKKQLSLEGYNDYLNESNIIFSSEKVTKKDKPLIKQYKTFNNFLKLIGKLKIFNTSGALKFYKKKKFGSVKEISFNRITQQFEII